MKILNTREHLNEVTSFFEEVEKRRQTALVWQHDTAQNKRVIYKVNLNEVKSGMEKLTMSSLENKNFYFKSGKLYFYVEEHKALFSADQISIQSNYLECKAPSEVKFLDEESDNKIKDVFRSIDATLLIQGKYSFDASEENIKEFTFDYESSSVLSNDHNLVRGFKGDKMSDLTLDTQTEKISTKMKGTIAAGYKGQSDSDKSLFEEELSFITVDEEDKIYEGQRAAPRARPPEGKRVTVCKRSDSTKEGEFLLFDLSRGGCSFTLEDELFFEKGEVLHLLAFDEKKFDDPMLVKVMNVREVDQTKESFKVGCKFLDEDEINDLLSVENDPFSSGISGLGG